MFFEFGVKQFEQRKGIGGAAGETGKYLVMVETTHLPGIAFHDGVAKGDLTIAADDHLVAASDR